MARRSDLEGLTSEDLIAEAREFITTDLLAQELPDFDTIDVRIPVVLPPVPFEERPLRTTKGPSRVDRPMHDPFAERPNRSVGASAVVAVALVLLAAGAVFAISRFATVENTTPIENVSQGDCFNEPSDTSSVNGVDLVDCSEPHQLEVFGSPNAGEAFGSAYPGDGELFEWADGACAAEFELYVGPNPPDEYGWIAWIPTEGSWEAGDRAALCLIAVSDDGFLIDFTTGSARDVGR